MDTSRRLYLHRNESGHIASSDPGYATPPPATSHSILTLRRLCQLRDGRRYIATPPEALLRLCVLRDTVSVHRDR
jgi:hypothetical protein